MLRDLLNKLRQRKALAAQMENEARAADSVSSRRKTANERELERFYEEARQEAITNKLNEIRSVKRRESWSGGNNILHERNVFVNHHSILTDNPKLNSWAAQGQSGGMFFR